MRGLVVGVDGSPAATAALLWAADHLEPGGALHAVHAVSPGAEVALGLLPSQRRQMVESARTDLEGVWTDPVRQAGAPVRCRVSDAAPAEALVAAAGDERAGAIVIGCHGSGRSSLLRRAAPILGSAAREILHHTPVPVVVLGETGPADDTGPVVVGIDDEASEAAADWAAGVATERRRPLVLAHALGRQLLVATTGRADSGAGGGSDQPADYERQRLIDRIRAEHDHLEVRVEQASGPPKRVLADLGASASLLVLGKDRRHPLAESITGPVIHHVLTHGTCPVAVVPSTYQA
jgi:nucleotide-binding universal stress UspA family protein